MATSDERAAFETWFTGTWSGEQLDQHWAADMWTSWQACAAQQAPQARAAILGWAVVNAARGDRPRLFTDKLKAEYEAMWDGDEVVALAANPQQSNEDANELHAAVQDGAAGVGGDPEEHAAVAGGGNAPLAVQACRPEDRAMLQTEAGQELLRKAAAALDPQIASEPKEQTDGDV